MRQYLDLLAKVAVSGVDRPDRTGPGTWARSMVRVGGLGRLWVGVCCYDDQS